MAKALPSVKRWLRWRGTIATSILPIGWKTTTYAENPQTRRPLWLEEVVEFFVDDGSDLTDSCEFEWNALGACVDLHIVWFREGVWHMYTEWDAKGMRWAVKTGRTVNGAQDVPGWQCEIAIPFTVFRDASKLPPNDGDVWRMNHYRIEMSGHATEYSCGSPVLGEQVLYHRPHRFRYLVFKNNSTLFFQP